VNVPTDYYATGYLERDTKPHSGSSYKRIKDGFLQELVNYVMERSSDQRGLYRITVSGRYSELVLGRHPFWRPPLPKWVKLRQAGRKMMGPCPLQS
jgi:hypothetical protein